MAMVKWTPGAEWETLRYEMNRLFERALPEVFGHEVDTAAAWPRLDVRETAAAYVVETDLPGMMAEAITVEAEGPYVVVKGERRMKRAKARRSAPSGPSGLSTAEWRCPRPPSWQKPKPGMWVACSP